MKSTPRHILVLTQYYAPDPNFITQTVADGLSHSARVTVITSHPNYPSGNFSAGFSYWRPEKRKEGNVTVWRLPMIPDRSASIVRRGISYMSFAIPAMLAAPLLVPRADVVWVYQTPFTTALAAWFHKFVRRSRIVFASADLWPESFLSTGVVKQGLVVRMSFAFRRWMNSWADLIICSTAGTAATYAREGVDEKKLAYIPIWVEGVPDPLPAPASARESVIVYAGNIGPAQRLETLIRAAALVRQEFPALRFELYGVGSAEAELQKLAIELDTKNVYFMGTVSPEEAFRIASRSLAQVISLRSEPLFRMTVPSKVTFALASGSPILAGLEGEALEIVTASGAAISFNAADPGSMADAIRSLLAKSDSDRARMGASGQKHYLEKFERGKSLSGYLRFILNEQRA